MPHSRQPYLNLSSVAAAQPHAALLVPSQFQTRCPSPACPSPGLLLPPGEFPGFWAPCARRSPRSLLFVQLPSMTRERWVRSSPAAFLHTLSPTLGALWKAVFTRATFTPSMALSPGRALARLAARIPLNLACCVSSGGNAAGGVQKSGQFASAVQEMTASELSPDRSTVVL